MFAAAFGDGAALGPAIDYVTEEQPLGTGGGIRNAARRCGSGPDDPVVVLNGDVLSGHDLGARSTLHVESGADVTLHLVEVDDPSRVRLRCRPTTTGRVTAFLEKTPDPVDQPDQRRLLRLPPRGDRRDPGRAGRCRWSARRSPV